MKVAGYRIQNMVMCVQKSRWCRALKQNEIILGYDWVQLQ